MSTMQVYSDYRHAVSILDSGRYGETCGGLHVSEALCLYMVIGTPMLAHCNDANWQATHMPTPLNLTWYFTDCQAMTSTTAFGQQRAGLELQLLCGRSIVWLLMTD